MKKITLLASSTVLLSMLLHGIETKMLRVGEIFELRLKTDPMNRYQWIASNYSDVLDVSSKEEGDTVLFTIRAKKAGRSNLRLAFKMPQSQHTPTQSRDYAFVVS